MWARVCIWDTQETRLNKLVFIGKGLDKAHLQAEFLKCKYVALPAGWVSCTNLVFVDAFLLVEEGITDWNVLPAHITQLQTHPIFNRTQHRMRFVLGLESHRRPTTNKNAMKSLIYACACLMVTCKTDATGRRQVGLRHGRLRPPLLLQQGDARHTVGQAHQGSVSLAHISISPISPTAHPSLSLCPQPSHSRPPPPHSYA